MNIYAWIGLLGIIVFTLLPFLNKKHRSKEEIRKAFVTISIVLGMIIAVTLFNVNFLIAFLLGVIVMILCDKKTYTKKRLIIYGVIVLILGVASYFIFRDNPDYVFKHLKTHPESSSLYVAKNDEKLITYQSDVVRPLASTVKILIAIEYAMQVDEGILNKDSYVSLDDLKAFYYQDTDGNAHETWLKSIKDEGNIHHNQVTLHDVAKGMITYSSNANTDYLLHLIGIKKINERAKSLKLTQHEEVYPLVSALLIADFLQEDEDVSESKLVEKLEDMPMSTYRDTAKELSLEMKNGTINIEDYTFDMSFRLQKLWSDRLIGASADDYGKLLAIISNDELPTVANETVRDLMEWPMVINEDNHKHFSHLGAKGGSTAFILNDAMYAEDHNGDKFEIVLLTDELNIWQQTLISHNLNSFESKLLGSEDYRLQVQKELSTID